MKYHFKVRKEGKFYWAKCVELEGCFTQATSMKKLQESMQEALNLYIQEPEDSLDVGPFPRRNLKKTPSIHEVPVNPTIAFAFMVRYHRIKKGITQNQAAKKMGFDNMNSYQRLEGKQCNPTLKIMQKVKSVFPEFSIDLAISC